MSRDDIQELLGGYATGTLTPEEQQILFSAALEDQELFDALAREQSLRDLLQDPGARAHLLAALEERPEPWYARWWRPAALALATAGVAALALVLVRYNARPVPQETLRTMAEARRQAIAPQIQEAQPSQEAASRTKPAPVADSSTNAAFKRKSAPPPAAAEKAEAIPAAPELPSAPAIRDIRPTGIAGGAPGGVVGGVIGGVPAAAPPPPPKAETPARDLSIAVMELAGAGNQRARMLFFGSQGSAFVAPSNEPGSLRDEPKQKQTAEQPRAMMRSASGALPARAMLPGMTALGIRYTLLRKIADGNFEEVAPGGLQAGGTVEIRFEANQAGYLSVLAGDGRVLAASNVSRRIPYTIAPIGPIEGQVTVRFSRAPLTGPARPSGNIVETPAGASDHATYVAGSDAASDPLVFTIPLKRP